MAKYLAIGLMSGTSLDGLDICACNFQNNEGNWNYKFIAGETIAYTELWKNKLLNAPTLSALELALLNNEFGDYLGAQTNSFIAKHELMPDLISSHGHTVFHQPQNRLTLQIGSGACIAAATKLPVICDFRTVDIALNGQGAPLVPAGEKFLFSQFPYLINIGGFANISFNQEEIRAAFDICPANIVLNELSAQLDPPMAYDKDGLASRKGNINEKLLQQLNDLDFYQQPYPKSLGKEWVEEHIQPLLKSGYAIEDKLATFTEHIAINIANILNKLPKGAVLITGGGAFNVFLLERIKAHARQEIIIPDKETVNFKEAIIFAFLGILRINHKPNALKSVTGADFDNIGGAVYQCMGLI
jgi:anhydro-N-acetylmuramic acid kinase